VASCGASSPVAQAVMTADEALSASAALSIFGNSNSTFVALGGAFNFFPKLLRPVVVGPSVEVGAIFRIRRIFFFVFPQSRLARFTPGISILLIDREIPLPFAYACWCSRLERLVGAYILENNFTILRCLVTA
jgi:hypothetical protein